MRIRIPLLVSEYLCNRANTRANRVFVSALVLMCCNVLIMHTVFCTVLMCCNVLIMRTLLCNVLFCTALINVL